MLQFLHEYIIWNWKAWSSDAMGTMVTSMVFILVFRHFTLAYKALNLPFTIYSDGESRKENRRVPHTEIVPYFKTKTMIILI